MGSTQDPENSDENIKTLSQWFPADMFKKIGSLSLRVAYCASYYLEYRI